MDTVPDLVGPGSNLEATCFDVELQNPVTGQTIGTATDCLSNIGGNPVDGLDLVGTTFFNLPGGTIVTRGNTTVQPTTTTVESGFATFTHITGANAPGNSVITGSGRFRNATGTVRLSGTVDLSMLDSDGLITFDCLFVIDLDTPSGR